MTCYVLAFITIRVVYKRLSYTPFSICCSIHEQPKQKIPVLDWEKE